MKISSFVYLVIVVLLAMIYSIMGANINTMIFLCTMVITQAIIATHSDID